MLHDRLRSDYIFCDTVNWCIEYLANNRAQNNASTPCIHHDVHHEQIRIMQTRFATHARHLQLQFRFTRHHCIFFKLYYRLALKGILYYGI